MGQQLQPASRIEWVDSLKGLGMLFVILSHTAIDHETNRLLYAFHMPLFFFISGLLFRPDRYPRLDTLVKKRFTTLLIPYASYAVGSYLLWFAIARHHGADAAMDVSPWTPLVGMAYSVGSGQWLMPNCPLWFLTCLFITEVWYWTLQHIGRTKVRTAMLLVASASAGYWMSRHVAVQLPWGADVAMTAVVFYGMGHLLRPLVIELMCVSLNAAKLTIAIAGIVGCYGVFIAEGQVDMSRNILAADPVSFYLSAACGIVATFAFIRLAGTNEILNFIGSNSLPFLALQIPALAVVKAVQLFVFGIPLTASGLSLSLGICQSAGIISIVVPLVFVINRWFPFLAGQAVGHSVELQRPILAASLT